MCIKNTHSKKKSLFLEEKWGQYIASGSLEGVILPLQIMQFSARVKGIVHFEIHF